MSTASGLSLLMAERRRQVELMTKPLRDAVASINRELIIYYWCGCCLQGEASAARLQLGWNGEWSGRRADSWTLKQWARAADLLYRGETPLPTPDRAGAMRAWADWHSRMDDEPPGATETVVGIWRWRHGQVTEQPGMLPMQPSIRAQDWAYAVLDAIRDEVD